MKVALVFDSPRGTKLPLDRGAGGEYLRRVIDACAKAAGVEVELSQHYAVADPQPGGKAPPIKAVRDDHDRFAEELYYADPDKVISFGATALNAVANEPKALTISKKRGVMYTIHPAGRPVSWVPTISHLAVISKSDLHRDLANDVYKALRQAEPLEPLKIDVLVPGTLEELDWALRELDGAGVVGVDVETTGLRAAYDDLTAVGIGALETDGSGVAVIITADMLARSGVDDLLYDAVWRKSRRAVGHNFKFDMQFLAPRIGWAPSEAVVGDTLLLSYLLDERPNRPTSRVRGLGLKDQVATRYDYEYGFDFDANTKKDEKYWNDLYTYLGDDVCYTARLWFDLEEEAKAESPRLLEAHEKLLMPVSRTIAKAELGGAPIDRAYVERTIRAYDGRIRRRKEALERAIVKLAPTMVVENILAPQQVADVMYDEWGMTPDVRKHGVLVLGDRSTDKDHIKSAVAKYLGSDMDRQARWLRSLEKLRRDVRQQTTYQKTILGRIDPDGRIRSNFMIHGTSTGRLSSRDPNLQNITSVDREDSTLWNPLRRAFRPENGLWVEVDYSQLELRVAAALSQDEALIDVFRSGRDVHAEIASAIFHKPAEQISKGERFLAKAVSFGIIYGRGGKALSAGAEMRYAEQKLGMKPWTEDEANIFIKQFLSSYPKLNAWMERLYDEVPKAGYVESPYGRRRRFPLYPKSKGELGSIQRQGVNTPVQSAASDLCLEAMVEITEWLEKNPDTDAQVLFAVHDSICLEVAEDQAYGLEAVCKHIMEKDWRGVPLAVDFEAGPTWADVKELA